MGSNFSDIASGLFKVFSAKKNAENARGAAAANVEAAKGLDWEPEYAQNYAPKYRNTESPLARSYLESMLTGNNSDMTFSGSPNASFKKAAQDKSRDEMYGTPAELQAQSLRQRATQNYDPKPITRQVGVAPDGSSDAYAIGPDAVFQKAGINELALADINKASGKKSDAVSSHGLGGAGEKGASILIDGVPQAQATPEQQQKLLEMQQRGASQAEYDAFWKQVDQQHGYKKPPKWSWNPFKG